MWKMFLFQLQTVCKTNTQFLIKYFLKYYFFSVYSPAFAVIKFLLFVYAHEYFSYKLFKDTLPLYGLNICQLFHFFIYISWKNTGKNEYFVE